MRFGLVRLPFFPYSLQGPCRTRYTMLARPGTMSMADLFVLREVLIDETYADILPLLPRRRVTVLDIGANLGSFCVWLAARHGIERGTCFEPDPSSFRLCRFNLSLNACAQVEPVPKAVGGVERTLQMLVNTIRPGGNSIYAPATSDAETAQIDVVPLTQWLTRFDGQIDVAKIDCEGAEWEILEKTPLSDWERIGLVVAEVHGDPSGRRRVEEFPGLLEKVGFITHRWDGKDQGLYIGARAANQ